MGDKSPKAKQKGKNQKDAVKTQSKTELATRQAGLSSPVGKDPKKK